MCVVGCVLCEVGVCCFMFVGGGGRGWGGGKIGCWVLWGEKWKGHKILMNFFVINSRIVFLRNKYGDTFNKMEVVHEDGHYDLRQI